MSRANRFLNILKSNECDCAIVCDSANVRYLSGFTGSAGYLLISENERLLVTDSRYTQQAKLQAKNFEIRNSASFSLKDYGEKFDTVLFEDESVSYKQYLNISNCFKNLKPIGKALLNMRSVKDEDEISLIRQAEKIGDEAFLYALSIIKEGMSEIELARQIDFYMLTHGAEALSFDTIVASGKRGSMPHAYPTENTLKKGDLVVMDFGCVYNGYCSDMTRTVAIGSIDEKAKDVYNTVLRAQKVAMEKIKAGVICADIHKAASDIIDENYKGLFGHGLGHGVGLEIHEEPTLSPRGDYPLLKNTVVSVEPGIYIPDFCGVRIEDLVLVTDEAYENLTSSSKELIII